MCRIVCVFHFRFSDRVPLKADEHTHNCWHFLVKHYVRAILIGNATPCAACLRAVNPGISVQRGLALPAAQLPCYALGLANRDAQQY